MTGWLLALLLPLAPSGAAERKAAPAEDATVVQLRERLVRTRELLRVRDAAVADLRPVLAAFEGPDPYPAAPDIRASRAEREGPFSASMLRVRAANDEFTKSRDLLERMQDALTFTGRGAEAQVEAMAEFDRSNRAMLTFIKRLTAAWEADAARYEAELRRRKTRARWRQGGLAGGAPALLALCAYGWRRHRASRIVLPGYRIERRLRCGDTGPMYEAVDLNLHRRVAVREVSPEEAESAAAREHPGVGKVYAVLRESGRVYLVFELPKEKTP